MAVVRATMALGTKKQRWSSAQVITRREELAKPDAVRKVLVARRQTGEPCAPQLAVLREQDLAQPQPA